jgi:hypothetical protein
MSCTDSGGRGPGRGRARAWAAWLDGWGLALLGLVAATLLATHWVHAHWLVASRDRIGAGEVWRLVTGPLVAQSFHQLVADLVGLALAGVALGPGWHRRRGLLLGAALVLPTVVVLALGDPSGTCAYYGLSGTVYVLATAGAIAHLRGPRRAGRWHAPLVGAVLGIGLTLHAVLPRVTEALNPSMVLAAHRDGGTPYRLDTKLPRYTCGPRALCWYVEHQLGQSCDPDRTAKRIWNRAHGTHIDAMARELTRRSGQPYDVVRLSASPGHLACVVRCQPPIALVDVGWHRRKSHFVVVHRADSRRVSWYDVNRGQRQSTPQVFARAWRAYDHRAVVLRRCLTRCGI